MRLQLYSAVPDDEMRGTADEAAALAVGFRSPGGSERSAAGESCDCTCAYLVWVAVVGDRPGRIIDVLLMSACSGRRVSGGPGRAITLLPRSSPNITKRTDTGSNQQTRSQVIPDPAIPLRPVRASTVPLTTAKASQYLADAVYSRQHRMATSRESSSGSRPHGKANPLIEPAPPNTLHLQVCRRAAPDARPPQSLRGLVPRDASSCSGKELVLHRYLGIIPQWVDV